jgi:hypothetical protein
MTRERVLAGFAVVVAIATNAPILRNFFTADDFEHLVDLANFGAGPFLLQPHAGHMYLVRNSVFTLHVLAFGARPLGYFVCALATHTMNVLMLFALVRRLTVSAPLACLVAILFGVSPSNAGTLGWYSVYGHALATTWVLLALLLITAGPASPPLGLPRALAIVACMLAASQSFGTGASVALVLPIVVALVRPATFRSPAAAVAVCAVPFLVILAMWAILFTPTNLNPHPNETIFWMSAATALPRIFIGMMGHLVTLGVVTLVLGGAYPTARYPDAVSAVTVVVWALAVSWAFVIAPGPVRRALVAFVIPALACYAAIAVGRTFAFAALVRPGALAQAYAEATRYHYLAQALLAIVTGLVLREAGRLVPGRARAVRVSVAGWAAIAIVTGAIASIRADHHDGDRSVFRSAHNRIAIELQSQPPGTVVCLPNRPAIPFPGFPGDVGVFMIEHRRDEVDGRRVFFVSADGVVPPRDQGGRLERLLRRSDDCPPASPGAERARPPAHREMAGGARLPRSVRPLPEAERIVTSHACCLAPLLERRYCVLAPRVSGGGG